MNSIEIYIENLKNTLSINIDLDNNIIFVNGIKKSITNEKIESLFRIIREWENNYNNNNTIDGENFSIKIITNNNVNVITGNGDYPKNYIEFKNWIGEFYE